MGSPPLFQQLAEHRVLVVAGAGGVGKTTVAAALALAGAAQGRRVLCLTVDPAKRLADRLGLTAASGAEQQADRAVFERAGLTLSGELTLVLLDTKRTFDDLIRRNAPSKEVAERVLRNEFYEYVSTQLAGTQAYMAMEKVLSVLEDARYDLIVLDTPPTSDALDFLDAPARLVETLDSAALRWLAETFERSGRSSFNFLARGMALVLRAISRLTGQGFLERLGEFVTELNQLFGGFKERAVRVARAFRGPEFAYLLVATPAQAALGEAGFFAERLRGLGLQADALIVNRVRSDVGPPPTLEDLQRSVQELGLGAEPTFPARILEAADAERLSAVGEREKLTAAFSATDSALARIAERLFVPAFPESVHDVQALVAVTRAFLNQRP